MVLTLEVIYQVGAIIYAMLRRRSDGFIWNTVLNAGDGDWEAWNPGNWAQYAIPLVEQSSSGYYVGTIPAGIGSTFISEVLYVRAGGTPASSDAPPFILSLSQGQGIAAVSGVGLDAANMAAALSTEQTGEAVGVVPGPLEVTTDLIDTADDVYLGRVIIWTSGNMVKQAARISAYNGTTKVISVLAWASTLTPEDGDTFVII